MYPSLRDCDQLGFAEIEQSIVQYAEKARSWRDHPSGYAGWLLYHHQWGYLRFPLLSTPIINPPQSAILGMHSIQERPVAVNGEVVIRPMMYTALSYDHRVVDGRAGGYLFGEAEGSDGRPCSSCPRGSKSDE